MAFSEMDFSAETAKFKPGIIIRLKYYIIINKKL